MVLPTSPPAPLSISQIFTEFQIANGTQKLLSNDLFPLVGGTAGATCSLGASFSGQSSQGPTSSVRGSCSGISIFSMAIDPGGNIYGAGTFTGPSVIYNLAANPIGSSGGASLPDPGQYGVAWAILVKWNSSGVYQSVTTMGGSATGFASQCVACDSGGSVYWSGSYVGNPNIFNMTATWGASNTNITLPINPNTSSRPFLIKFNSIGNYVFSTGVDTGTSNGNGNGIAIDSSGNIYWTLQYNNFSSTSTIYTLTLNPNTSSSGYNFPNNSSYGILIKYNSSGTYQSLTGIIGSGTSAVKIDSSGNIYFCGYYSGTNTIFNMAQSPLSSSSGYSWPTNTNFCGFVAKYNSAGTYQNSMMTHPTNSNFAAANNLNIDSNGNLYVCGAYANGSTIYNFNTTPNGSSSGYSLPAPPSGWSTYIIKYNSSGTYQYSTAIHYSGAAFSFGMDVMTDSGNNVYFTKGASTTQTIYNMSANPNTSSSGYSIPAAPGYGALLIKWNSSGTYQSATNFDNSAGLSLGVNTATGVIYWGGRGGTTFNSPIYDLTTNPNSSPTGYSATSNGYIISYSNPVPYAFTDATFTSGGQTGPTGPIISQVRSPSSTTGTPTPSNWYNTYLNMTTQGIQLWTVPITGVYTIRAVGGSGSGTSSGGNSYGGRGVIVEANFTLTQGAVVKILVGQGGAGGGTTNGCEGTGGGGTFVVDNSNNPIIVAGGGGGAATATYYQVANGQDGLTTTTGGTINSGGAGGTNGSGGSTTEIMRAPGAGFSGNAPAIGGTKTPAYSFLNGGVGGTSVYQTPNRNGGFGGGGCGDGSCCAGAGSAGGYSGGGSAGVNCGPGAGGGSYIASSALNGTVKTSDGSYGGAASLNGYSVTNLGLYNTAGQPTAFFGASGYVTITKGDPTNFVMASYAGVFRASDVNSTWSSVSSPPYFTVMAANTTTGRLVALNGSTTTGYYSDTSGATWISTTLPSAAAWTSCAWSPVTGRFVAVGNGGSAGAYSDNGINWSPMNLPVSQSWTIVGVRPTDGRFVAFFYNGSTPYYSNDGINWTAGVLPAGTVASWQGVAASASGVFVAAGGSAIVYSSDGINWSQASGVTFGQWSAVAYSSGLNRFVAVAGSNSDNGTALYSTNGSSWSSGSLPYSQSWYSITCSPSGRFFTCGYPGGSGSGDKAAYSFDGINWTAVTLPSVQSYRIVVYKG